MPVMRTIRASELGAYLYCKRAWWYQKQDLPSENRAALDEGSAFHAAHGRQVLTARLMRLAGSLLLIAALTVAAVAFTLQLLAN